AFSQRNITKILDIPKSTVVLSEHDSKHLVKIAKENRSNTLEEITENFNTLMAISVSTRTVQRILHKEDYSRHAAKKPFISEKNCKKRYGW
ncbi:8805_t:CDS:2, partial [Funneliformis geosporum]